MFKSLCLKKSRLSGDLYVNSSENVSANLVVQEFSSRKSFPTTVNSSGAC